MKGSEFVFDYVQLLYYKCLKINLNRGGSYIDSPVWIKNKEATINPINKKDNKCFQQAVTVSLNYEEIKKDLQRITKIKPSNGEKQWHYHAVKELSALLRGITSKNNGDLYCPNCLYSFRTKKTDLNLMKNYVKIKIFAT